MTSLVILSCSNLSASTPSLKPLPPARLTRPKCVAVVSSSEHPCQSRKDRHLSPRPSYRPAPAAPVGLPAHSPEDRKSDASASPFPTSYRVEREYGHTLQGQCIVERHLTQEVWTRNIFIGKRKYVSASATRFLNITFKLDILVIAINMLYATYVVKTCKNTSKQCRDFIQILLLQTAGHP